MPRCLAPRGVLQAGHEGGDFFLDDRIDTNRMTGRKHQAVGRMFNFWPHQSRRINQDDVIAQIKTLLRFGHCRLITHFRNAFFQQRIHQR